MVYTIEIVPEPARESALRSGKLGYKNSIVKSRDVYDAWPEHAPFDIIIVTAAHD
jgi:protein-L-isoaspartate(D-aspartate) O-methyltransferase